MNKLTSLLFISLCFGAMAAGAFANSAAEILKTSGVTGGLIVIVGCEDPDLIADLHANDATLVQALDTNPAKVAKVREHIKAKGLYVKAPNLVQGIEYS